MTRKLTPIFLVLWLVAGCSDDTQGLDDGDDPFITGDPVDPVICVGDPDSTIVCKKQSEFWDCEAMPNGEEKCTHNEPVVPNGSNSWECSQEGDKIVCKTNEAGAEGGADWSCTTDGEWTTCEKDAPAPPGGGDYTCTYDDNEFTWSCTGEPPPPPPSTDAGVPPQQQPPGGGNVVCFEADSDTTGLPTPPEGYWAKIIAEKVLYNGVEALHAKVIFSKAFVDNTYGANALEYSNAQGKSTGHSFGDLEESDKAEVFFNNRKGDLIMHMAIDYISASSSAPSGYASLGVGGGDGQMIMGDEASVLGWQTSLAVNFNQYGYVLTDDSPATDETYKPDPAYPNWIWEVWYEVWVDWSVYGGEDPGKVYITGIHASPSKVGDKTLKVTQTPCP